VRGAFLCLGLELLGGVGESVVGVLEEDEAEDGDGVVGGAEPGVRAKLVRGVPEVLLQLGVV
jgi:hypothetical protein